MHVLHVVIKFDLKYCWKQIQYCSHAIHQFPETWRSVDVWIDFSIQFCVTFTVQGLIQKLCHTMHRASHGRCIIEKWFIEICPIIILIEFKILIKFRWIIKKMYMNVYNVIWIYMILAPYKLTFFCCFFFFLHFYLRLNYTVEDNNTASIWKQI